MSTNWQAINVQDALDSIVAKRKEDPEEEDEEVPEA